MSVTRYTELSGDEKSKPGPKSTGTAKLKVPLALKSADVELMMQWASQSDPDNKSKAAEIMFDDIRRLVNPERGTDGKFVGNKKEYSKKGLKLAVAAAERKAQRLREQLAAMEGEEDAE